MSNDNDDVQVITVKVRGVVTEYVGNHLGVLPEDQLGLARVINVRTGETLYLEKVSNGVRDSPEITVRNYVDHHALKREAEAQGQTYRP